MAIQQNNDREAKPHQRKSNASHLLSTVLFPSLQKYGSWMAKEAPFPPTERFPTIQVYYKEPRSLNWSIKRDPTDPPPAISQAAALPPPRLSVAMLVARSKAT